MLSGRVTREGKFLFVGREKFLPRACPTARLPRTRGDQFPPLRQVAADFAQMRALGVNTVRTYTVPSRTILDEAARAGLRVMVGLPWAQHVAFLDDAKTMRGDPPHGRRQRHDSCAITRRC